MPPATLHAPASRRPKVVPGILPGDLGRKESEAKCLRPLCTHPHPGAPRWSRASCPEIWDARNRRQGCLRPLSGHSHPGAPRWSRASLPGNLGRDESEAGMPPATLRAPAARPPQGEEASNLELGVPKAAIPRYHASTLSLLPASGSSQGLLPLGRGGPRRSQ